MRALWNKLVKFGLPVAAAVLFVAAIIHVTLRGDSTQVESPPSRPAGNPYARSVAGAGIVEARTDNIQVAAPEPAVVESVHVQVNDRVRQGDPLFTLDTRLLQAELAVNQAALASARAELQELKNQPRPERVPIAEAAVEAAEAELQSAKDSYVRNEALLKDNVSSPEEVIALRSAMLAAEAQLDNRRAELKLLRAGAWRYEIQVAEAAVQRSEAAVQQTRTRLERRIVKAPVDGTILRVELEPGEFVGTPPGEGLLVMGDIDVLHVRVNIDEYDIPRFRRGASARAIPRGETDAAARLSFVRVEPLVVPKESLTGRTTERVDTRVLQVIYAVEESDFPLYVGQQVDVYIDITGDEGGSQEEGREEVREQGGDERA